ncbi:carbohydrate ABC transporter permease [Paenibacillus sp. LHD-38]|uniref:carbohydrate ABC transporter permease n=1 Tax=Paenibacillus sp. LHD-38 TaxID=3072143 RepID=UPI00280C7362|nr:carbohydrate ABC transporter permease [Paenibacillus sp. LHD-38]MDQ8739025.1 carbohydrate ABC transporter permease [Paenibacillus sp. LHD-38]
MSRHMMRDRLFHIFNTLLMLAVIVVTLAPFWFSIIGSLNEGLDYMRGGVHLWPRKFSLDNYVAVFSDSTIYQAYITTIARTLIGTITHVLFVALFAYGISREGLKGRGIYTVFVMITMFFGGGLIPTYLLYKELGLLNNFLVYIIPSLFSVWDAVVMIASFRAIPNAIIESAKMDGAGEYRIFFRFILPLSKPLLAAIALFTAVYHWNSYFDAMMYTTSNNLQTVQLFLMRIVTEPGFASGVSDQAVSHIPEHATKISPETLKLAMMVATAAPILVVYPFLQKYFVKGVLVGSIKG